ncbi:phosphotransferase-like protein [Actinopolymorpha alba]|uniref:phosphotransferase-like protein n=1 Tax=Actinopolymorpha alba TaxID=533267 RepID=UPI0003709E14|nr:AAA family ATPase [Actinopolymorpha alba]
MPSSVRTLVILLSGPSSSGKTTLARALLDRCAVPVMHVEADRAFPAMPAQTGSWDRLGLTRADAVLAFHRSIAVWAQAGFPLIVDGSLPYEDRELRDACLQVFGPFDLRLVGVRASLAALNHREVARPEVRPAGWAARQAQDIHDGMEYAATVDTSNATPDECADRVLALLGLAGRPA